MLYVFGTWSIRAYYNLLVKPNLEWQGHDKYKSRLNSIPFIPNAQDIEDNALFMP